MVKSALAIAALLAVLASTGGCASTLRGIGEGLHRNECAREVGRSDREACEAR
mgnify:CR=1 FL=1